MVFISLLGFAALIFFGWLVNGHLARLAERLDAIGTIALSARTEAEEAKALLTHIERHTRRQAKHLYKQDDRDDSERESNPFYYAQRDAI